MTPRPTKPSRKTRSGPNIPQAQRVRKQVSITLSEPERDALDRVAERRGLDRSRCVAELALEDSASYPACPAGVEPWLFRAARSAMATLRVTECVVMRGPSQGDAVIAAECAYVVIGFWAPRWDTVYAKGVRITLD